MFSHLVSTSLILPRSLCRRWLYGVSLALGHALFESLRALKGSYLVFPDEKMNWQKNGERQGGILLRGPSHPITDKDFPPSTSFHVLGEWLQ